MYEIESNKIIENESVTKVEAQSEKHMGAVTVAPESIFQLQENSQASPARKEGSLKDVQLSAQFGMKDSVKDSSAGRNKLGCAMPLQQGTDTDNASKDKYDAAPGKADFEDVHEERVAR